LLSTFSINAFNGGTTGLTSSAFTTNSSAGMFIVSGTPSAPGTGSFTVNITDSAIASLTQNYTLTVTNPPPSIADVVINQDISFLYNAPGQPLPGVQRSMVNDIVYTFGEPVNILSPAGDPNVFSVAVAAGWTGIVPNLSWTPVASSGNTQWAVSFSGAGVNGGSIANGAYTITVGDPSAITAVSDGQALQLQNTGIGSATQSFYRLFGDLDGPALLSAADTAQLM
jgi:hypothetical protein